MSCKYHELQFGSWDRLGHWAEHWCGIRKLPRGFLMYSFCVHDCLALQMGGQIVPSTVLMRDQIVLSHLPRVSSIFFTWWLEFPACSSTFCLSKLVKQCAVPQCKPAKTCSSDSCCGPFNAIYSALNFEQCLTYAHIDAHLQDLLCRMEMTPLALPSWILLTLFSHVVLTVRSCIKLYMWGFQWGIPNGLPWKIPNKNGWFGGAPMTSESSRCDFLGHPEPGEVHNVYGSDTVRWAARNTLMVCSLVKMPIQDLGIPYGKLT